MASRSNGSGRTSKRKGSASLSRSPEAQVMTHSLQREKGRNLIQERVGSKKRLIFAESLRLKGKRERMVARVSIWFGFRMGKM